MAAGGIRMSVSAPCVSTGTNYVCYILLAVYCLWVCWIVEAAEQVELATSGWPAMVSVHKLHKLHLWIFCSDRFSLKQEYGVTK